MKRFSTGPRSLSHCSIPAGNSTLQQDSSSSIRDPNDAMAIATLNDIFFTAVERNLDRVMLYRDAGKWRAKVAYAI